MLLCAQSLPHLDENSLQPEQVLQPTCWFDSCETGLKMEVSHISIILALSWSSSLTDSTQEKWEKTPQKWGNTVWTGGDSEKEWDMLSSHREYFSFALKKNKNHIPKGAASHTVKAKNFIRFGQAVQNNFIFPKHTAFPEWQLLHSYHADGKTTALEPLVQSAESTPSPALPFLSQQSLSSHIQLCLQGGNKLLFSHNDKSPQRKGSLFTADRYVCWKGANKHLWNQPPQC